MVFVDLLPEEIKKKLRCAYCPHFLSTANVTVTVSDNHVYHGCGRCSKTLELPTRSYAYEALASFVTFPCRYSDQGCNKQLAWGSVLDHEKCCKHRIFPCIIKKCGWMGGITQLSTNHLQENHAKFILKCGFFQIPYTDMENCYIYYVANEIFLVEYKYTKKTNDFLMRVRYIGTPSDSGRFTCDIKIRESNKKKVKTSVDIYNGKVNSYRDYGKEQEFDIKVDISVVRKSFKSSNFLCDVDIIETIPKKPKKTKVPKVDTKSNDIDKKPKEKVIVKNENKPKSKNMTSNDDFKINLLRELECPICQDYMLAPIYVCSLGHSICGDCKIKLKNCPTCLSEYGDTRNYTLENMLQLIKFPCQNHQHGCEFNGSTIAIRQHRDNCKFEYIQCPTSHNCDWKGTVQLLLIHLKSKHDKDIIVNLNEATYTLNSGKCDCLAEYEGNIFRISCRYSKGKGGVMQWSFQQIFINTQNSVYKMEIEFLDQTDDNRKFIINDVFQSMKKEKDIFKNVLSIPISLLQPYVSDKNVLHFKYKIC